MFIKAVYKCNTHGEPLAPPISPHTQSNTHKHEHSNTHDHKRPHVGY